MMIGVAARNLDAACSVDGAIEPAWA